MYTHKHNIMQPPEQKIHRMLLSAASRASEANVADFSNKNTARRLFTKKKCPQLSSSRKYQASLQQKSTLFYAIC